MRPSRDGNEPNPVKLPLERSPLFAPRRRREPPFLFRPAPGGCLFLVLGILVGILLGPMLIKPPPTPEGIDGLGHPFGGAMIGGIVGFFAAAILSSGVALLGGLRPRQEIRGKASRDGWDEFA